jgi:hypothetical protein
MKKKPDEIEVRYFEDEFGRHPFAKFFKRVKGIFAAKITGAITRLRAGNTGDFKSVGKGVSELRIDWGPDTGSILDGMEPNWLSCCPVEPKKPRNCKLKIS